MPAPVSAPAAADVGEIMATEPALNTAPSEQLSPVKRFKTSL
jgi:hypothetical protein